MSSGSDPAYIPLEALEEQGVSFHPRVFRKGSERICGFDKTNLLLTLCVTNLIANFFVVGVLVTFTPSAYEVFQLIHSNKDRIDSTMESVLRISEEMEIVLFDIRSFLEFKLVDSLCASSIIRNTIGGFFCSDPPTPAADKKRAIPQSALTRAEVEERIERAAQAVLTHWPHSQPTGRRESVAAAVKSLLTSESVVSDVLSVLSTEASDVSPTATTLLGVADAVCLLRGFSSNSTGTAP